MLQVAEALFRVAARCGGVYEDAQPDVVETVVFENLQNVLLPVAVVVDRAAGLLLRYERNVGAQNERVGTAHAGDEPRHDAEREERQSR